MLPKSIKDFWVTAGPKKRNMVLMAGAAFAMIVVATVMDSGSSKGGPARKSPVDTSRTQLMLPKAPDNSVEALAADSRAQSEQLTRLQEQLKKETADKELLLKRLDEGDRGRKPDAVTTDLLNEVVALKTKIQEIETRGAPVAQAAASSPSLGDPLPGASVPMAEPPAPAEPVNRLRVSGEAKKIDRKAAVSEDKPVAYIPAGSFLEASLLNGMDAPVSSVAQKNPVPAVMRVKTEAVLPNHFSQDVKECFVLVSGFGVLSSERVQLRTETISCVKEDGKAIEAKIDGYVVGEDGSVGPRGRLVSKQGQLIARSLAAGVLAGFGEALTPQAVPQLSLSPSGTTPTTRLDAQTFAATGVARGFSDASKAVSGFFLEMAREATPVVEINAGRKLTIVVIKGFELK
ncbi:TraB/VirB10 family protein [Methylibium petroleiphilum]|uniref:Sex pilus assembly protein n=1 Tax=Methylibium petroleiphilum (strain ATCC BAA-1232 / LMG 22953 / PM1) TaxID=420662 RepID=A2SNK3_METPP|nr:TraB/VirB10 family protein [Methylibium petroleiphilum]ABM97142.1 sex pilus assembly protein [Methylibium petroleiphilum PM1]